MQTLPAIPHKPVDYAGVREQMLRLAAAAHIAGDEVACIKLEGVAKLLEIGYPDLAGECFAAFLETR